MGIATVAVYSDADRDALHVEMADEAGAIGPPAAEDYLQIDKIVEACSATGADAVRGIGSCPNVRHFRSRSSAGIHLIGPNPKAIAAMGDQVEEGRCQGQGLDRAGPSRRDRRRAAGGSDRAGDRLPGHDDQGIPGGGEGMRIAHSSDEVAEGFARALGSRSRSATTACSSNPSSTRAMSRSRCSAISTAMSSSGERECSIQRRNQKVLEEAPSPLLDEATRARIRYQAVALAKAVGYNWRHGEFGEGTDKSFFFLEMNTRLQVEHPVTELVTGIDLVEMIRVAAGEHLSITQSDVKLAGWAVESRSTRRKPIKLCRRSAASRVIDRQPRPARTTS